MDRGWEGRSVERGRLVGDGEKGKGRKGGGKGKDLLPR